MLIGLILSLGLITIYCGDVVGPTSPPTVTNTNTNTNIINQQPSPEPAPDCIPTQVNVSTDNGLASIPQNNPTVMNAFPLFKSSTCRAETVTWESNPSGACTFSNQTNLSVTVRCPSAGTVVIGATVNGKFGSSEFVVG